MAPQTPIPSKTLEKPDLTFAKCVTRDIQTIIILHIKLRKHGNFLQNIMGESSAICAHALHFFLTTAGVLGIFPL
jgi:hypothetical protein